MLELKKGAAAVEIGPSQVFTAGKDATKVEQLFAPVRSTVIGGARVARLASIVRNGQRLLFAPVADSADGLGLPPGGPAPHWPPFGHPGLPPAPVGFAFAAPVLRLAEGERRIRLKLRLSGLPTGVSAATLGASFDAHLTGPEGWIGPLPVSGSLSGELLTFEVVVDAAQPAVVDHVPAVHLHAFPAALPVIQCLLKPAASLAYGALEGLTLHRAQIGVSVAGMRNLALESDESTLDSKKAFLPFGAQPDGRRTLAHRLRGGALQAGHLAEDQARVARCAVRSLPLVRRLHAPQPHAKRHRRQPCAGAMRPASRTARPR